MSKSIVAYKTVTVRVPAKYQYSCDTCGHIFEKGERKVTYYSGDTKSQQYACKYKPCSPFSDPKDYDRVWSSEKRCYVWEKV